MLFIGKQYLVRETTEIDDVNAWLQQRMGRHPDGLTRGLGHVNFEDNVKDKIGDVPEKNKDEAVSEGEAKWSIDGVYATEENILWVDIKKDYMADVVGRNPELIDDVRRARQAMIEWTIDHELEHYAHQQRLPIAWLRKWHEATELEDVNVTYYVDNIHSDNPTNSGNPSCEDLAESGALYLNQPGRLLAFAPLRFTVLNERDGRYDAGLVARMRTSIDSDGYTESAIEMFNRWLNESAGALIAQRNATPVISTFTVEEI
jgi:hypothetical protein